MLVLASVPFHVDNARNVYCYGRFLVAGALLGAIPSLGNLLARAHFCRKSQVLVA